MTGPRPGVRGWFDRIMASRHRRSILGSFAVLALLVVVLVVGLFQGDSGGRGDAGPPTLLVTVGASHRTGADLPPALLP